MENPLISIVIPVYNRIEYLRETLKSVILQSYTNLEIIVVDDGSDEDIESLVTSFKDSRFSYYKLSHKNANVARNFGIQKSNGSYIAMLDSDDLWLPEHIQGCLKTIREQEVDGKYGSLKVVNTITKKEQTVVARHPFEDESIETYLIKTGFGAQTSTLFMTSWAAKRILWDEEFYGLFFVFF
jgi:glycosyltransferase involved in cell wall biosynthesis